MIERILPHVIVIRGDFQGRQTAVSEWGVNAGVDVYVTRFGIAVAETHSGSEDVVLAKLKSTAPEFVESITRLYWKQYEW